MTKKQFVFAGKVFQYHETWNDFLDSGIDYCLKNIETKLGNHFTPNIENILLFMTFDLSKLKVVILGQDPYPQFKVATGRAFEVGNIRTWDELRGNTSVQNILKLICKNYLSLDEVPTIEEVRKKIRHGDFNVLPPDELFVSWENQGVLLINTSLTCEIGKPNSHANYWACFSQRVIDYVADNSSDAKWLLWGNKARSFGNKISNDNKYDSDHPRLNTKTIDSFLVKNHFLLDLGINWAGYSLSKE